MSAQQIDVLAVLRDDFVDASVTRMHDKDAHAKAARSEDAIGAVAELIVAADIVRRASPGDREPWDRLNAALARVGGLKSALRQSGGWIAADDVRRLVRELDVALNGRAGAAPQASLCDIVGQVQAEARRRGAPLLAALRQSGEAVATVVKGLQASIAVGGDGEWVSIRRYVRDQAVAALTTPHATSGLVEALERIGWHELTALEARDIARAALAAHDARGGQ